MTALLTQSTTERATSASMPPSVTVSSLPSQTAVVQTATASPVGPSVTSQVIDDIEHRDPMRGYITVPVCITHFDDGVVLLNLHVQTAAEEQAVMVYRAAWGSNIQVLSGSQPRRWYSVSNDRCQCYGFGTHHHCKHMDARRQAVDILETWQFAQRQRARAARCEAMQAALDNARWEVA